VIPPEQNASFVHKMEQVLDVYERAYDPSNPVVCLDESPRQLTECRTFTDQNGKPSHDSEYIRHGVRDLYMCYEPLAGKRYVEVEENHNRFTWVKVVAGLLDDQYKDCRKITLVQDNLSAHKPAAFYEVFAPAIAKAYLDRLQFIFTPAHGSWLNMAEIEFSVLNRKLDGYIHCPDKLKELVLKWQKQRNKIGMSTNWQFTTKDARVKLIKLYPTI
jgi:hypothetical protein